MWAMTGCQRSEMSGSFAQKEELNRIPTTHKHPFPVTGSPSLSSSCQAGCAACSALNGCLSCKPRLFFYLELNGMRQRGTCLSSCPRGHYGTRSPRISTCNSTYLFQSALRILEWGAPPLSRAGASHKEKLLPGNRSLSNIWCASLSTSEPAYSQDHSAIQVSFSDDPVGKNIAQLMMKWLHGGNEVTLVWEDIIFLRELLQHPVNEKWCNDLAVKCLEKAQWDCCYCHTLLRFPEQIGV